MNNEINIVIWKNTGPSGALSIHVLNTDGSNTFNYTATSSNIYIQIRQAGTYYLDNIRMYRTYQDTVFVSGYEVDRAYRYGYNTQERVDEVSGKGNHYTAEFWEYSPRIGRRWNVDPVYKHHLSNYSVMSGNPISRVDPNGADDGWVEDETGELTWDENVNSQEDFDKSGYDKDKFSYAGQELQRAYSLGSTSGLYTQYYGPDGNTAIYDYPMWVEGGRQHIGLTEGGNSTIQGMIDNMNAAFPRSDGKTPISSDAEPWCGVFIYDCLTGAGQSVTQKPKTWQTPALNTFYSNNWAEGTVLSNPAYGAIAVMSYGHVAMVVGYDDTYVWILGGNQPANGAIVRDGTEVNITRYKRSLVSKYVIPTGYNAPPLGT